MKRRGKVDMNAEINVIGMTLFSLLFVSNRSQNKLSGPLIVASTRVQKYVSLIFPQHFCP